MKRKTSLEITKIKVSIDGTTLYLNTSLCNVIETPLSKHTRCYFSPHLYSVEAVTDELISKLKSGDDVQALRDQAYPPAVEMTKSYWKRSGRIVNHYARMLKPATSFDKAQCLATKVLRSFPDDMFVPCKASKAAVCEIGFEIVREAVYVKVALLDENYNLIGLWRRNYADEMPMNAVIRQLIEVSKLLNGHHKPLVVIADIVTYLVAAGVVKSPTDSVHNLRRKLLQAVPDVQFRYGK